MRSALSFGTGAQKKKDGILPGVPQAARLQEGRQSSQQHAAQSAHAGNPAPIIHRLHSSTQNNSSVHKSQLAGGCRIRGTDESKSYC